MEVDDASNPVLQEVAAEPKHSAVAVAGHPLHAMMVHFPIALVVATLGSDIFYWWTGDDFWVRVALWSSGFAFAFGLLAGAIGTAELLLVSGIRLRVASWAHAIAAMALIAVAGANWGGRAFGFIEVLPHGIALSVLSSMLVGLAGYHGGKLIFDHNIGLMVSPKG
jgi:uncharacterized membrane protein